MKPTFVLSLLLNAILLALGAGMLSSRWAHPMPALASNLPSASPQSASASQAAASPSARPFRWDQLAVGDYRTYIRDLRAIGCPEATIRDILAAAIGRDYDKKLQDLQARRTEGEIGATDLQDETARLWSEQNDLLASLFGTKGSFGADGTVARASGSAAVPPSKPGLPSTDPRSLMMRTATQETAPLVFVEPDPSWGLTPEQLDMWYQTRDNFAEAIGGESQDPKDPAYHQRWAEAKAEADQRLKTLFGFAQFSKWQMLTRSQMPPPPAK